MKKFFFSLLITGGVIFSFLQSDNLTAQGATCDDCQWSNTLMNCFTTAIDGYCLGKAFSSDYCGACIIITPPEN